MSEDSNQNLPFGKHLMLELYHCAPETLNDKDLVQKILKELPENINMRILTQPVVAWAEPNGKKDSGGWSGFVMIHESHMTIHTFIKRGFVTIDVYSCAEFDENYVIDYFKKIFKTDDAETHLIVRGKKFPAEDLPE